MDGTLYDSMPNHVKAWQQMLREAGIEVEPAELLLAEGRTGTDTVRQLFMRHLSQELSDEDCRRLYRRKAELFTSMPPVTLMPGAQKLVKAVCDAGLTT
ncbi:MAG: HAD hydrolase-like protein, partial [Muribaculaceae bacterium]|nr:HAD hydrolase-like protein [Muribaculaceae bacterium]